MPSASTVVRLAVSGRVITARPSTAYTDNVAGISPSASVTVMLSPSWTAVNILGTLGGDDVAYSRGLHVDFGDYGIHVRGNHFVLCTYEALIVIYTQVIAHVEIHGAAQVFIDDELAASF